jgi:hypothetical protein
LLQRAMLIRAPPMGQLATTQFRIFDEARVAFVSSSLQYFRWLV